MQTGLDAQALPAMPYISTGERDDDIKPSAHEGIGLEIMRDPRVRAVEWRDLANVNRFEVWKELTLSAPWIIASFVLASRHWYLPALACSFIFFLTGLRQVHNAYHYALGISKTATEWVTFFLSVQMLGSMHAIMVTHLHHHRHCMDDEDVEASSARMKGWQAILLGPLFPIRLHWKALQLANAKQRQWILAELFVSALWVPYVWFLVPLPILRYHVLAMAVGQCLTAFFAVWTVHHDCDRSHFIARTLRGKFRTLTTYEMFYHVEHHLFPKVPTCHLPELSRRLDEVAPELQQKRVF